MRAIVKHKLVKVIRKFNDMEEVMDIVKTDKFHFFK